MKQTDKAEFTVVLARTWRFYDKAITPESLSDWWDLLEAHDFAAVAAAFQAHLTDPRHGRYPSKPADILQHLQDARADGHPEPEEAWGLLARFIGDERETGCYTEPMRVAWRACQPVFDLGDEIGARMTFLETYRKALRAARERREPPRWRMSLGTDPERRTARLWEAVDQPPDQRRLRHLPAAGHPGSARSRRRTPRNPGRGPGPGPARPALARLGRAVARQRRPGPYRHRTGTVPERYRDRTGRILGATHCPHPPQPGAPPMNPDFEQKFLGALLDPATNLEWGCRYLATLFERHDPEAVAAAYNAGSARQDAAGRWRNQEYVDQVKSAEGW